MKIKLEGVYPPIATPFDADGEMDAEALAGNIRRWNRADLAGYVVGGSNGESVLLRDGELCCAVEAVRAEAPEDKVVIAGTGRESTRDTIALTQEAARAGAQAALVMTPSFFAGQMTHEALLEHYQSVADASEIPIILYNVPKFTHLNLLVSTAAALARHDNIVGLKDSAGDIAQIIALRNACPGDFAILVGNGGAFYSAVEAGASGAVLALANVAPQACADIARWIAQGRHEDARRAHARLFPVNRAITVTYGIPGLKAAMDLLGYYGGPPRPPLMPVSEQVRDNIGAILRQGGLLA